MSATAEPGTAMRHAGPARGRGDHGVTLILFALAMVAILIMVAIVIDLGGVRESRQDNKRVTDAVATAAIQSLAPEGVARPWPAVCQGLTYLQRNLPDRTFTISYRNGTGATVPGTPCASLAAQECVASTPTTWAWIRATSGDLQVDIRSGYRTPDPSFPEDATAYAGDNGVTSAGGCDQLAVILSDRDPAYFGRIVGSDGYDTEARSVARVPMGGINIASPAFLILERTECNALQNSVGGSSRGIIIRSPDGVNPGLAHVDSNGTASNCSGSARTLIAESLPDGTPSMVVEPGSSGPGIIALNALAPGGSTAYAFRTYTNGIGGGLSVRPTAGRVVSRAPVDRKYNPPTAPAISQLHLDARAALVATGAPAGATTLSCNEARNGGTITGTNLFIDCSSSYSPNADTTFSEATSITFRSGVSPGNNRNISFPVAETITIRGQLTAGNSGVIAAPRVRNLMVGGGIALTGGNHDLQVNSTSSTACTGGGSTRTRVVVFGGPMQLGGRAALCATTVYLAGPLSLATYARQQVESGGTCSATLPFARTTGNVATGAQLLVTGGQVVWTAPNEWSTVPPAGSQGTEDLALWTESADQSQVSSGGTIAAQGVFFLPNAAVDFSSPTSATPRNAQFIARTLYLRQGTLEMRPVVSDSVWVPASGSPGLVR